MRAFWSKLYTCLTESRLVRQLTESLLRGRGRRLLLRLDQEPPERSQTRILLGLLHRARNTQFGRDHDFRRIRTPADYRRLVPLRSLDQLWQEYWQPSFPRLDDITWPGPITRLATRGACSTQTRCIPLTAALHSAHQAAFRTGLALVAQNGFHGPLFSGRLLLASDVHTRPLLETLSYPSTPEVADRYQLLQPYSLTRARSGPGSLRRDEVPRLQHGLAQPVTCLAGPPERLLRLAQQVKEMTGKASLQQVWPELAAVFCAREGPEAPPALLQAELGERVQLLEAVFRPEGTLALTDPRHGRLRLLTDHQLYFELLRLGEGEAAGERVSLERAPLGVPCELVLTSPAGLWACRSGLTVVLEQLHPPLVRLVPAPHSLVGSPSLLGGRQTHGHPASTTPPLQAPHRQTGGSPVRLPETFAHSPWSIPVDRG